MDHLVSAPAVLKLTPGGSTVPRSGVILCQLCAAPKSLANYIRDATKSSWKNLEGHSEKSGDPSSKPTQTTITLDKSIAAKSSK
ncbi:Uncharacterized protein HZ326_23321 [Fusarium oxysporum f. sp. albedinis]|nr:Uncharacterized protein HZ326_23321 [Fusarium oxysporum f. sp. albedinis]